MARDGDSDGDGDGPPGGQEPPVRRGSVDLRTRDGEAVHYDEAFVRYEQRAFVVSVDAAFPAEDTEWYPKSDVAWIQVRHPRR